MTNYDSWLERPYQQMYEETDRFTDWAEEHDYDLNDPVSCLRAEQDYEAWLADMAESWAEEAYERHQDWLMDRYDSQYDDC